MTNDLYNVIGDPKNWPTIAQNIDGGEYLVEQHAVLLAWARRKAAEYGAADDLSQLPQPREGPCADCAHDQHPDNHHYERFTIGQRHFCRAHAVPRAHAAGRANQPLRTPPLTLSSGSYPTLIPGTWEEEHAMRRANEATARKAA